MKSMSTSEKKSKQPPELVVECVCEWWEFDDEGEDLLLLAFESAQTIDAAVCSALARENDDELEPTSMTRVTDVSKFEIRERRRVSP